MKASRIIITVLFSWGIAASLVAGSETMFVDHFNNNNIYDSDDFIGFWGLDEENNQGNRGTEQDGHLHLFVGRPTGTSSARYGMVSTLDRPFDITGDGVVFDVRAPDGYAMVSQTGFDPVGNARMRVRISRDGTNADAFELYIRADQGGSLRFRENNETPWNTLADFDVGTDIVRFRLMLSELGFTFHLYDVDGEVFSESGPYTINPLAWVDGAVIGIAARDEGSPEGAQVDVRLGRLTVLRNPPRTLGLFYVEH